MHMVDRVAVVTGASSGIGKVVARTLVGKGWRVIGTGRDAARSQSAEADIKSAVDDARFEMLRADLSLLSEADRLAREIAERTDRIHILFNNAGGMTDRLEITDEGLEANFAANHLGPFLLTDRLLPLLRKAAEGEPEGAVRILMTSSDASEMIPSINVDDLQNLQNFNPGLAYCAGKLANVLSARGLAKRLEGTGIVAHAMAPGPVSSNFYNHAPPATREAVRNLAMLTEVEGADTLIWLAECEEAAGASGGYWEKRQPRSPHALANDPAFVDRFWKASEKLVASALST